LAGDILAGAPDEELHATIFEGLHYGAHFVSYQVPAILGNSVALAPICIVVVEKVPWRLLPLGGAALLSAFVAAWMLRPVVSTLVGATQSEWQAVLAELGVAIDGRLDIVARGLQAEFSQGMRQRLKDWQARASRTAWLVALATRAPMAAALALGGVALALDGRLRQTMGQVWIADAAFAAAVFSTFLGLTQDIIEITRAHAQLHTFATFLSMEPAPLGGPVGTPLPRLPASIEWRDVSYAYRGTGHQPDHPAIRGVSIAWRPGRVLTLEGPNGSGKSTLLRLLLGLGRPGSGGIIVDGIDLFSLDLTAWRRSVAYLPQKPCLSERMPVRAAIHLLAPRSTDQRMRDALERVELWAPLMVHARVGDPLSTPVGSLSGGERQRLALARLLCEDGPIVLLDEPTTGLDAGGVALVERIVRELSRDRMVAVAAHSPQLLQLGDIRVVLAPLENSAPPKKR
jgi:ABC-type multidrug transport system fused ATPase/permease subunit